MGTKEAIKNEFMQEYARKNFSLITVKGLCATPVARSTFYSYYDNTDDVKNEIEDELISGILRVSEDASGGNFRDMDFSPFMDAVEAYIKERWSYIYTFLVVQPNLRFIQKWKDAIKFNFRRRYPDKQNLKNYDAIAEILASSMTIVYLAAIWLIVIGIIRIILANKLHKVRKALDAEVLGRRWWLVMIAGILLVIFGILSLFNPAGLIVAIGIHFGLNIIIAGANMIAVAM